MSPIELSNVNRNKLIGIDQSHIITSKTVIIYKMRRLVYFTIKNLFDVVCSIIALLFLIPLAIFVKIAYLLSGDTYSIFLTQKRIGRNGREFDFYKFRSMVPDADNVLKELLANDKKLAKEYKINKKLKDDPRITKIGKFLRKTSLDEFPQFINVLKGDMSIIGNRPYLPREKKDMKKYFNKIVKTTPGITGYWQVSGRSNTTFVERFKLESYYSKHANFIMDIKIFFKTFAVVIFKKGAK